MALPTFFIIGAPKAGTTSLHYYLDQHPQVQMSAIKEPNFFISPRTRLDARRRVGDLGRYERLFDPAMGVRGEASTSYADHPRREGVPERIKELVPDAKFIYLVRDPVDRTVSHYRHLVASEGERRSLKEVLSDLSRPYSPCICPSLYALQLERYLQSFPQERMLVIDHAELLADRRSTLGEVFDFLSVDGTLDSSRFDEELLRSSERHTYPPGFARLVGHVVVPCLQWLPASVRRSLRRSVERAFLPPLETSTLDDESRARLEELYTDEVERLRALTGKTFSAWSV
ncbi:MAG: sulfotransferase family protein [Solirubrobacteraceae bacterium]